MILIMSIMKLRTATEARENFSEFLDDVVRKSPQAIKRHRDSFITMSPSQMDAMLPNLTYTVSYDIEQNGSFSGTLEDVEITGNAETLEALMEILASYLVEYAQDYLAEFNRYFHSPNRRAHFPYIMKAVAQPDVASLAALFRHA